jgi:Uma2 family endonuclease
MTLVEPVAPVEAPPSIPLASLPGMTADEFLTYCSEVDFCELIRGEVVSVPPAGMEHVEIEGDAFVLLRSYSKANDLGVVLIGDIGYILERDPYTVRAPDISFLSKARLGDGKLPKGFCPGAPDFAVEILSPTDTLRTTEMKIQMYLRTGTKVAWIMNPGDTTIRVYRPGEEPKRFTVDEEIDAEPALPGFRCTVWRLFGMDDSE